MSAGEVRVIVQGRSLEEGFVFVEVIMLAGKG